MRSGRLLSFSQQRKVRPLYIVRDYHELLWLTQVQESYRSRLGMGCHYPDCSVVLPCRGNSSLATSWPVRLRRPAFNTYFHGFGFFTFIPARRSVPQLEGYTLATHTLRAVH